MVSKDSVPSLSLPGTPKDDSTEPSAPAKFDAAVLTTPLSSPTFNGTESHAPQEVTLPDVTPEVTDDTASLKQSHPPTTATRAVASGGMRKAALLTIGSTGLSSLLGLANFMLMARLFGVSRPVDAYLIAQNIPQLLGVTFGPRLSAYLVPWLISLRHSRGSQVARSVQVRLLLLCPVVTALFLALCYHWNRELAVLLAPGFDKETDQALVVSLMQWTFAGGICVMFLAVLTSIAHSHERFGGMALAAIINPATTLVLLISFGKSWGVTALAAGFLLGPLLGCLPVLWSLRGVWHEIVPADAVQSPSSSGANGDSAQPRAVPPFSGVFLLAVITTMHVQIPVMVGRNIGSTMGEGVIAGLGYAAQFSWMPITILANSVGNTLLPALAKKHQTSQEGFSPETLSNVTKAIRVVAYVLVPLAMVLLFYSYSVVGLAFASGGMNFNGSAVILTANMITCYTPAIWIGSTWMVLIKLVQARNEHRALFEALALGIITDVCLALILRDTLGYVALPIANSANCTLATLWLLYRTRKSIPLPLREITMSLLCLTGLALGADLVVYIIRPHTPWWVTAIAYTATFLGLGWLFKVKEQTEFWSLVLGRGLRKLRA